MKILRGIKINKFYEITLITNQVEIKNKYIDKDEYIIKFLVTLPGYANKVFNYIQDKTNFLINVRNSELQSTCKEFISKCN